MCFYLFWLFFKILNLSLIFYSLNTIYLHVFCFFFLVWILLGLFFCTYPSCCSLSSLNLCLVSDINFGGNYIIASYISSVPFSLLLPVFPSHMCYTFLVVLQSLAIPFYLFSCSFCFSVLEVSIAVYHFFVVPSSNFHISAYIAWLFLYVVYFIH